jgi:hypothetical protein
MWLLSPSSGPLLCWLGEKNKKAAVENVSRSTEKPVSGLNLNREVPGRQGEL